MQGVMVFVAIGVGFLVGAEFFCDLPTLQLVVIVSSGALTVGLLQFVWTRNWKGS